MRSFGVALLTSAGSCRTYCVDHVDAAIAIIRDEMEGAPAGVGVDAPLWWCSGPAGMRRADRWIKDEIRSHSVQATNSLKGAVLSQGMMFVARVRELFPHVEVKVTETHPKALLLATGREQWHAYFRAIQTNVTLDGKPDHERDAVISAVAAREGFEGRWTRDLIHERYPSEQDPLGHWLAPIHYFWPK